MILASFVFATACTETPPDGDNADGGGGGGSGDDRAWVGTSDVTWVDFNGNSGTVHAEATWVVTSQDEDGTEYAPQGTVSITRDIPGCTVTFDPASHAIDPASDSGFLRVEDGTYRGFAGTYWSATSTMVCPPNAPVMLPETIAVMWLNTPTSRPLTAPDRFALDEQMDAYRYVWAFTRQ